MLCAADGVEGMVGREDDAHVLGVVAFLNFFCQALGIGGGGVTKLVGEGFHDVLVSLAFLSHLDVGAHGEAVKWNGALLRPLRKRLREEIEAGDKEEDELVFPS